MIIFSMLAAASAYLSDSDILANIQGGRVICTNPDDASHTCSTISSYEVRADGSLLETSELLIAPAQGVTLTVKARITLKDGAVCGTMLKSDLDEGRVKVGGQPIPDDRNKLTLAKLEPVFASLYGKEACEVLKVEGDQLLKIGRLDGVEVPLPPKRVRWLPPESGFKVASPPHS